MNTITCFHGEKRKTLLFSGNKRLLSGAVQTKCGADKIV